MLWYRDGKPEPEKEKWKKKIRYRWNRIKDAPRDVLRFFRQCSNFVKKIVSYSPILWHDVDWDHHYFHILMKHKLSRMEKLIRESDRHFDAQADAKKIRIAIFLLDRIIKGEYFDFDTERHELKWGPQIYDLVDDGDPRSRLLQTYTEKSKRENLEEQEKKEWADIRSRAEASRKNDLDYLYKHLRKNIQKWWE